MILQRDSNDIVGIQIIVKTYEKPKKKGGGTDLVSLCGEYRYSAKSL